MATYEVRVRELLTARTNTSRRVVPGEPLVREVLLGQSEVPSLHRDGESRTREGDDWKSSNSSSAHL